MLQSRMRFGDVSQSPKRAPATKILLVPRPLAGLFYLVCLEISDLVHERLLGLIEPVIEALGYELVLLEYSPGGGASVLRLYIDSPGGINVNDCTRVSREVSGVMEVEDPIRGAYQLEVSSPGLDRPLAKAAHYERFMGLQAKVQLLAPRENSRGRRRYAGVILAVTGHSVTLDTADGHIEFEFSEIERARLVPDFEQGTADS
jgi:ribosome maturation factor RimP